MRKLMGLAVLLIAGIVAIFVISGRRDGGAGVKWDQRAYVNLRGTPFLDDFPKEKIRSLPAGCQLVGHASRLNPEADYYATDEVSGLEVYQDLRRFETLYVKRESEYGRYTMTLALCPLLCYEGRLYIREGSLRTDALPYITRTEASRPADKQFASTGETLFLGEAGTLPRRALETNDPHMDGGEVLVSPEGLDYLCVSREDNRECYVQIVSCGFPEEWEWAAQPPQ